MNESDNEAMLDLISLCEEYSYSIVAFTADEEGLDFGTPKKPSAFIKKFADKLNILRFEKSTEKQLYAWLKKHFDSQGVKVGQQELVHGDQVRGQDTEVLDRLD